MNMHNWGPRPNYETVRMDEMGGGPRDGDDPGGGRRVALLLAVVVLAIAILVYVSNRATEDDLSEADASATVSAVLMQQPPRN